MSDRGERILTRAMKAAVKKGLFPKRGDTDLYLENREIMREILEAALKETELEGDMKKERVPQ